MSFNVLDCIRWLQYPEKHPITGHFILDMDMLVYENLCSCVMKRLLPEEIYELNPDMFKVLGLDKLYKIEEIPLSFSNNINER